MISITHYYLETRGQLPFCGNRKKSNGISRIPNQMPGLSAWGIGDASRPLVPAVINAPAQGRG